MGRERKAWKIVLICLDTSGAIDDPEELEKRIQLRGYARRFGRIRCDLVSGTEPVDDDALTTTALTNPRTGEIWK